MHEIEKEKLVLKLALDVSAHEIMIDVYKTQIIDLLKLIQFEEEQLSEARTRLEEAKKEEA